MSRRLALGALLGVALAVLASATAQAAVHDIKGRDSLDWDRPYIAIEPGDAVRWSFDGTQQTHNVQPEDGTSWMPPSPLGAPAPPWEHTFDTEGVYTFLCVVHKTTMRGTIEVTRTPAAPQAPPPPPPLSEQPFANDATSVLSPETVTVDRTRPALTGVRARRVSRGARVRFRVSELSTVTITLKRGDRFVKLTTSGTGTRAITVGHSRLRSGRYTIQVRAIDIAGNRSRLRTVRLNVRR